MRVDFTTDNKTTQFQGFPKVTLEKDEDARVCILDQPLVVYKHSISKPVIDPETGNIAKIVAKTSKGDEYEKDNYEYVGAYVCNGDPEKIDASADNIDPENCQLCAAVAEYGTKFKAPTKMFACHVIQYKTKPGTTQVQEPFGGDLKLWILSPTKFNSVVDLAAEHGDIRMTDIMLTDCTSKNFQNYKIGAGATGKAAWLQEDTRKNYVQGLLQNNSADDDKIKSTVARKLTDISAKTAIEDVLDRWALEGSPMGAKAQSGEFGGQAAASQAAAADTSGWDFSARTSEESSAPDFAQEEPKAEAPKADPAPAKAEESKPSGGAPSFEDIMNSLG